MITAEQIILTERRTGRELKYAFNLNLTHPMFWSEVDPGGLCGSQCSCKYLLQWV